MPCTWDTLQLKFKFNDRDTWYHRFYQELFYEKKIKVNVKQIRKSYKLIPFYAYSTESLICFIIELRNIGGLIYFDCPTVFAQHFSTERLAFLITFIHRQIYRIRNTVFAAKYVIYYSGILIVLKRNSVEMLWYSLYKDNILYLINLIRITFWKCYQLKYAPPKIIQKFDFCPIYCILNFTLQY